MEEQTKQQTKLPSIEGIEHRLYRAYDENTETWIRSNATATKRDVDSCVHRYGREVGFVDPDEDDTYNTRRKVENHHTERATYATQRRFVRTKNQDARRL
jgi:hypothetical protein